MFIFSSVSSGLELWSIKHISKYKNSEFFKNIKLLSEILSNWSNDLLGKNAYKSNQ